MAHAAVELEERLEQIADLFITKQVTAEMPEREELHRRTVKHLILEKGYPLRPARFAAAKAIANYEAKEVEARVDLSHSSSTCVFITIGGNPHALTVKDLLSAIDISQAPA